MENREFDDQLGSLGAMATLIVALRESARACSRQREAWRPGQGLRLETRQLEDQLPRLGAIRAGFWKIVILMTNSSPRVPWPRLSWPCGNPLWHAHASARHGAPVGPHFVQIVAADKSIARVGRRVLRLLRHALALHSRILYPVTWTFPFQCSKRAAGA